MKQKDLIIGHKYKSIHEHDINNDIICTLLWFDNKNDPVLMPCNNITKENFNLYDRDDELHNPKYINGSYGHTLENFLKTYIDIS